jgi:hypothetical protein
MTTVTTMRFAGLCLIAFILAGCATAPVPAPVPGEPVISRGHLVMTPEMQVIVPCNTEEPLWVVADEKTQAYLLSRYPSLVNEADEEAFAVLQGKPGPTLDCPLCRDFPGSFQVQKVLEYRKATPDDCH